MTIYNLILENSNYKIVQVNDYFYFFNKNNAYKNKNFNSLDKVMDHFNQLN